MENENSFLAELIAWPWHLFPLGFCAVSVVLIVSEAAKLQSCTKEAWGLDGASGLR